MGGELGETDTKDPRVMALAQQILIYLPQNIKKEQDDLPSADSSGESVTDLILEIKSMEELDNERLRKELQDQLVNARSNERSLSKMKRELTLTSLELKTTKKALSDLCELILDINLIVN